MFFFFQEFYYVTVDNDFGCSQSRSNIVLHNMNYQVRSFIFGWLFLCKSEDIIRLSHMYNFPPGTYINLTGGHLLIPSIFFLSFFHVSSSTLLRPSPVNRRHRAHQSFHHMSILSRARPYNARTLIFTTKNQLKNAWNSTPNDAQQLAWISDLNGGSSVLFSYIRTSYGRKKTYLFFIPNNALFPVFSAAESLGFPTKVVKKSK